ncbi:pseudouridine synthase [Candidatus Vidania fulgoroideorum]
MISKKKKKNKFFYIKESNKKFAILKLFYNNIYYIKKKKYIYVNKIKKKINFIREEKKIFLIDKKKNYLVYNTRLLYINNILSCIYNFYGEKIFKIHKCGIVHRIDYKTSGIIILAKNNKYHKILNILFKKRKIKKYYLVFCKSFTKKKFLNFKNYIYKKRVFYKKKKKYKYSHLKSFVIYKNNKISFFLCKLFTGRKNQIKVQFNKLLNFKYKNIILQSYNLKIPKFYLNNYSLLNKEFIFLFKKINKKIILK